MREIPKESDRSMQDEIANEPTAEQRRAASANGRRTLLIGLVGIFLTPAVAAVIQYTQWYFQNSTTQSQAYAQKLMDAERLINDIVYKRYWRTKVMFGLVGSRPSETASSSNDAMTAAEREFKESEINFRDQESFLRALLAIYVDLPRNKDVSNKREKINQTNPDCIKPNAFADTRSLDQNSASDVLQLVEHCHFLITEGIHRIRYLKQNPVKETSAKVELQDETNKGKVRLDQLWYIQDILMCLITETVADVGGLRVARDCDKDYRGQTEAFDKQNKEFGFEQAAAK
jgi:hypothetical protein